VLVFYAALLAVTLPRRALAPMRWQVAAVCAWIVIGFLPPIWRASTRDGLHCGFVALGHGTCVVLQAPDGETLLYDAGALGSPELATQAVSSYLWHRGISRIDGIVLSHADVDHYNAVPGLLKRFPVGAIYMSPLMFADAGFETPDLQQASLNSDTPTVGPSNGPTELRLAIERAGVPVRQVWAGDRLRVGRDVTLDVLHPPRRGVIGSDNANSITLIVSHAARRILLPGDLESPGLEDLTAELPRDCDVLLAPHHGSRRSDPPGFAAWSTPEWVVVSGGDGDVAPSVQSYETAGAAVFQTYLDGAVEFQVGSGSIRCSRWRDSQRLNWGTLAAGARQ
jgi:competence protein ComEC